MAADTPQWHPDPRISAMAQGYIDVDHIITSLVGSDAWANRNDENNNMIKSSRVDLPQVPKNMGEAGELLQAWNRAKPFWDVHIKTDKGAFKIAAYVTLPRDGINLALETLDVAGKPARTRILKTFREAATEQELYSLAQSICNATGLPLRNEDFWFAPRETPEPAAA